ncbi:MAG: hypothetical protein AAGU77_12920, partial [Bacillota bacterium]
IRSMAFAGIDRKHFVKFAVIAAGGKYCGFTLPVAGVMLASAAPAACIAAVAAMGTRHIHIASPRAD